MRRVLIVVALLTMPNLASAASYIDGNKLYEWLVIHRKTLTGTTTTQDQVSAALGLGYVLGTADSTANCIPGTVNSRQLADISLQYLEAHPGQRHLIASNLVRAAIAEKFPCSNTG